MAEILALEPLPPLPESARELPREKLCKYGPDTLNSEELLALILGRGVAGKNVFELSKEIAELLKTLTRIPSVQELARVKGLGMAKAAQVVACLELSSRFLLAANCDTIKTPEDTVKHLSFIKHEQQEVFVMLSLNSANRLINKYELTRGTVDHTPVHPREAFIKAIQDHAVSVIFAHNHPSGSLNPSRDDWLVTKDLCRAGAILGIDVVDHMIIGASGWKSLRRERPGIFKETSF